MTTAGPETSPELEPSSFRDPSGTVFSYEGTIYRQINPQYRPHYELLVASGLYNSLTEAGLLIPHEEVSLAHVAPDAFKVIRPERVPFISYPYEWSFSQLKAAALATLEVQRRALDHGLCLKDCSAYNIQFVRGRPLLIDTLSFERYREGEPWIAYRQFCQHFLAPLALMSRVDIRLGQLLRVYIDGVPLDLASRLLPARTRLSFSLLFHIHLHARAQTRLGGRPPVRGRKVSLLGLRGILDNLQAAIRRLRWQPGGTEWADYYESTNYPESAMEDKKRRVAGLLQQSGSRTLWDLGANTGLFSRVASGLGISTISFDVDPSAVEKNYLDCMAGGETRILPLLMDLTNPSPSMGWDHEERKSLFARGPVDAVLALALIHHLAISNNVPLGRIASSLARGCRALVVEFVPKSDSQVQRLLAAREDIFPDYTQAGFEKAFAEHFHIEKCERLAESERSLYLMKSRQAG